MKIKFVDKMDMADVYVGTGDASFGPHSQKAILGSCLSLIIFSDEKRVGGLTHICCFETEKYYCYPDQAIDYLISVESYHSIDDPEYFLVGGSSSTQSSINVYNQTISALVNRNVSYKKVDLLGSKFRVILLNPSETELLIHKPQKFYK